jgi:hypothetical protein
MVCAWRKLESNMNYRVKVMVQARDKRWTEPKTSNDLDSDAERSWCLLKVFSFRLLFFWRDWSTCVCVCVCVCDWSWWCHQRIMPRLFGKLRPSLFSQAEEVFKIIWIFLNKFCFSIFKLFWHVNIKKLKYYYC